MIKSKFQSNLILLLPYCYFCTSTLTVFKEKPNSTSISTSPLTLTRFVFVKKNLNRQNISGTAKYRYCCRVGYNPHRNWPKYKRGGNERVSLQSQSQIESGPRHALALALALALAMKGYRCRVNFRSNLVRDTRWRLPSNPDAEMLVTATGE